VCSLLVDQSTRAKELPDKEINQVPSYESEQIFTSVFTILRLDFQTVLTLWYFLSFLSFSLLPNIL